jgi:hypothetical protein
MKWNPGELIVAVNMAKSANGIHIHSNMSPFDVEPRVLQFEKGAIHGKICTAVKINQIPEGLIPPSNMNFAAKRNSISSITPYTKKRRSSKPSIGSVEDSIGPLLSRTINDPQFLHYQQQFGNRRHSYQPLTSYQEQQFAWMHAQPSPLIPNSLGNGNPAQAINRFMNQISTLPTNQGLRDFQQNTLQFPPVQEESAEKPPERKLSVPFLFPSQDDSTLGVMPLQNVPFSQLQNSMQATPNQPGAPKTEFTDPQLSNWNQWNNS